MYKRQLQEKSTGSSGKKSTGTAKSHKKFKAVYKTALGLTAAAAVFSTVCITNPAFAENIPLVGNVFKQLGNSLGFYGDYSKYAKQLTESAEGAQSADADGSQEGSSNSQNVQVEDQNTTENHNADKTKDDQSYSKTVDGTTVTLSEVYCNELAMYLSMTCLLYTSLARDDMAEAVEEAFRYGKLVLATITYNGDIFPFMRTYIENLTERSYQNRTIAVSYTHLFICNTDN